MEYIFERRINYYETDRMGIVHHSNYAKFLEEARCQMHDDLGLPYSKIEQSGIMIPVLELNCKYKFHVTFDDIIVIKLKIVDFTGVRMSVVYEITNKKTGELVMLAETKHCFTNTNLRPINVKKYSQEIYDFFDKNSE